MPESREARDGGEISSTAANVLASVLASTRTSPNDGLRERRDQLPLIKRSKANLTTRRSASVGSGPIRMFMIDSREVTWL